MALGARVGLFIASVGVIWMVVSYFQFRDIDVRDYSTISGTLVSAEEYVSHKSGHLDLRVKGHEPCYRVPADDYLKNFRRAAFFSEAPAGTMVQLTVLTSEVRNPRVFPLSSTPTVFVHGVRANGKDYCILEEYSRWLRENNKYRLVVAALGALSIAAVLHGDLKRRKAGAFA